MLDQEAESLLEETVNGNLERVQCIINQNLGLIDCRKTDGSTPLNLACKNGHFNLVHFLLDNEADVNSSDNYEESPLYSACRHNHEIIVEHLIKRGANFNASEKAGVSPLHIASFNGNMPIVTMLVENGADINRKDGNGDSIINLASSLGNVTLVEYLIRQGVNINNPDNNGFLAVDVICDHDSANPINQDTIRNLFKNQVGLLVDEGTKQRVKLKRIEKEKQDMEKDVEILNCLSQWNLMRIIDDLYLNHMVEDDRIDYVRDLIKEKNEREMQTEEKFQVGYEVQISLKPFYDMLFLLWKLFVWIIEMLVWIIKKKNQWKSKFMICIPMDS